MDINEVAAKVEQGVTALQTEQKEVKKNFDQLQTETKNAIGELTAVKNTVNNQAEVIGKLNEAIKSFEREQHIGSNPIARFTASDQRCNWLVGCFKKAAGMSLTKAEHEAVYTKTGVYQGDSGIGAAVTPTETSSMIYDALLRYGQWNTLGVVPIGAHTQVLPLISARPTAYWVAQDAAITEGAMTGTSVSLVIRAAGAWIPASRELLQDAQDNGQDMAGYLLEQLSQAVAYRLDWACFAADGGADTTDGSYTGIAVGGTAATAATGNTTVATLDLEDFVRCLTTVSAGLLQRPCKWWIHPQVLAKIVQIRDSNGRPIFQTALEAPAPGAIGSILGYPVVLTGAMPSTDSTGNVIACFGDPQGGAVGIRKQFELAQSDHFEFSSNNTCFRVIVRAGFIIKAATSFAKLTLA
jgi:HK97 family phage major capsid protein